MAREDWYDRDIETKFYMVTYAYYGIMRGDAGGVPGHHP